MGFYPSPGTKIRDTSYKEIPNSKRQIPNHLDSRQRVRGAVGFLLCFIVFSHTTHAQLRQLTLGDLFDPQQKINFSGSSPRGLKWLEDGEHYLKGRGRGSGSLVRVNAATGDEESLFDGADLKASLAALPGFTESSLEKAAKDSRFDLSPDEKGVLIRHAGDLFYHRFGGDGALRLTRTPQEEKLAGFSPDSSMVSFVRDSDLYVLDIKEGRERRLTTDGSSELLNGKLDWVYQEEIYGRGNFKGYWWSPDSSRIVYLQLEESQVPEFTVVDHLPLHLGREVMRYPKAGDPNPGVRLGLISAAAGKTQWVKTFKYEGSEFLITRVGWTPDSQAVLFQVQNRQQTWLDLNRFHLEERETVTLFREKTPAWTSVLGEPEWLDDGSFLWLSERRGWKHIYHYTAEGKLIRPITDGEWEVSSLLGADADAKWVYFSGYRDKPIDQHVYRVRLDGGGLTRLSRRPGTHRAKFNPQFSHFIDSWSDIKTPIKVALHESGGDLIRMVAENRVEALEELELSSPEFLRVKTSDGFSMEAMIIRPADFDPKKKYPVLCYVYGGPQIPKVKNRWGGSRYLWHQFVAQKGYIIWMCDNRSASGKGAQSAWPVFRNLGELELRDVEEGLEWLRSKPYVDSERIGIWGWSYGGYLSSYALTHSSSFKIGIAGAPVTDWRLYDTIYTERYMGLPQENPEGYKKSSVLESADALSGKLLLVHGTIDDNVHLQNTIQLIERLQKKGKSFEMMLYPKSRHGVTGTTQRNHLYQLMTRFILENL